MLLLQQMVIFFLIMLIGYICRKVGVFGENTGKMISGIVINIGNPALIIASGMNPETLENKAALLVTLAVALIFFAIMFVIAELIPRLLRADREDYGSYQVMTIFSNIGFMGYPLLDAMYGSEAVIHAAIFNLLYSVLSAAGDALLLGGRLDRQDLVALPRGMQEPGKLLPYNRCVMQYQEALHPLLMPCGEIESIEPDEDTVSIFG